MRADQNSDQGKQEQPQKHELVLALCDPAFVKLVMDLVADKGFVSDFESRTGAKVGGGKEDVEKFLVYVYQNVYKVLPEHKLAALRQWDIPLNRTVN